MSYSYIEPVDHDEYYTKPHFTKQRNGTHTCMRGDIWYFIAKPHTATGLVSRIERGSISPDGINQPPSVDNVYLGRERDGTLVAKVCHPSLIPNMPCTVEEAIRRCEEDYANIAPFVDGDITGLDLRTMNKVMDINFFGHRGDVKTIPVGDLNGSDNIYKDGFKIGVIVSTSASLPYIHLGLDSWTRNYSNTRMLIHDDASDQSEKLKKLANLYHADFETNGVKRGHTVGDLTAFYGGLVWAESQGIDLLVKFSRRFIPLYDWTSKLRQLAMMSQSPTFSNVCMNLNWGFRTECVALHVPTWLNALGDIATELRKNTVFCEGYIHNIARILQFQHSCKAYRNYLQSHPKQTWCDGHVDWDIMGTNRIKKVQGLLWHHSCQPKEYADVAKGYGLPYSEHDFLIPESHLSVDTLLNA